jgi:uncharacterized protein (TIGR03382 family)
MRANRLIIAAATITLLVGAGNADAFCGFYVGGAGAKMFNHATQVVLMRHGTTTVLSMQNNYQGPPERFALVVPVPVVLREQNVKTLDRALFEKIDVLGAPRLVEYWEQDPCHVVHRHSKMKKMAMADAESASSDDGGGSEKYKVKIEAKFSVAEYDIVVLSAKESTGLDAYLRANKYEIPKGAEPLLRPYVLAGTKFFVAKVDPKKVKFVNGMATLSPLRFHYDSPELALPIRLGLANADGPQDLIINILAPNTQRYEVANYPNVTIPTNLRVTDDVRTRFGEFYAALFDHTQKKIPNSVVTEYVWSSGSCDPCPGPTLEPEDIATFGGDVLATTYKDVDESSFTLTRLHARYTKDVKDDLVFRAVQPIVGGTGVPDEKGGMEMAVTAGADDNMFQGRYVILHPWSGPIACESPERGQWGGPPGRDDDDDDWSSRGKNQVARELAFAPRGKVELASLVTHDVPQIGVIASRPSRLPNATRHPQGCGCQGGSGAMFAGMLAVVLGLLLRRRRV